MRLDLEPACQELRKRLRLRIDHDGRHILIHFNKDQVFKLDGLAIKKNEDWDAVADAIADQTPAGRKKA